METKKLLFRRVRTQKLNLDFSHIHDLNQKTHLKVDHQSRMLTAAFGLAKRSFEHARVKNTWWFKKLPKQMKDMFFRLKGGEPNLGGDFKRAWDLFHSWYPKLQEEVRRHSDIWDMCKANVLQTMKDLHDNQVISQDEDKEVNEAFEKWMGEEIEKMEKANIQKMEELGPSDRDSFIQEVEKANLSGNFQNLAYCGDDPKIDFVRQNLQSMHAMVSEGDAYADSYIMMLEFFKPMLRVVWIVLVIDSVLIFEAITLGILTQFIFELNIIMLNATHNPTHDVDPVDFFRLARNVCLPVIVVVYAVFGAEMVELAHDGMQYPPFKRARASFIIALTANKGVLNGELDRFRLAIIDFFLTAMLLICMLGGVFAFFFVRDIQADDGRMDLALNGMMSGALVWVVFFVVSLTLARGYNNIFLYLQIQSRGLRSNDGATFSEMALEDNAPDQQEVAFRPSRCAKVLREALAIYAVDPGETWLYFFPLNNFLHTHKADDYAWNKIQVPEWIGNNEGGWEDFSRKLTSNDSILRIRENNVAWWWLTGSALVWICTLMILWWKDAENEAGLKPLFIVLNVGMMITLALLSESARIAFPIFADTRLFRVHIILFIFFMGLFSVASVVLIKVDKNDPHQKPLMTVNANRTEGHGVFDNDGTNGVFYNDRSNESWAVPYPACNLWWGKPSAKVSLMDLGAMATYAYSDDEDNFRENLNKTFGAGNANISHYDDRTHVPRVVAARLCKKSLEPGKCTVVMAVRGTSNKIEILTDLGIFSAVAVLQVLDKMAPVLGTVPVSVLSGILDIFRSNFLKTTQEHIIKNLTKTKKSLLERHRGDALVITGHSLGGAFAELLGALEDVPAIGFSAPGQFYLMKSYGVDRESVSQNIVTIMPSLDPVTHVASHFDVVQRIQCRRQNGAPRQPQECHSLANTMCELWRVCGDKDMRVFSQQCLESTTTKDGNKTTTEEPKVNQTCIGKSFSRKETARCKMHK